MVEGSRTFSDEHLALGDMLLKIFQPFNIELANLCSMIQCEFVKFKLGFRAFRNGRLLQEASFLVCKNIKNVIPVQKIDCEEYYLHDDFLLTQQMPGVP